MLRAVALVLAVLTAGLPRTAVAEEAPPKAPAEPASKVPLRLVRVLPEEGRAVIFDKARKAQTLVAVGEQIAGYTVVEIDETSVTLAQEGKQLVLAAPEQERGKDPKRERDDDKKPPRSEEARDEAAPEDPYAEGEDKHADKGKPDGKTPDKKPEDKAPEGDEGPKVVKVELTRRDLEAAIEDFGSLVSAIRGEWTDEGARLEHVADGSLFARAGLRAGDLVRSVDGKPMKSLDDAAELYSRAGSLQRVTVQVGRGGKAVVLDVSFR